MRSYALDKAVTQRSLLADYLVLAKPGIVGLVLVSTLTGMYLGGAGGGAGGGGGAVLDMSLLFWTLAGVGLSTAGACVLNNFLDRDIDSLMERTSQRALPSGSIPPANALVAGTVLPALGLSILVTRVNLVTATLTFAAVITYVVLYGMFLKRTTHHANQVGGIAGALPPLMGYAAVTGTLTVEALVLFAIVTLWQQPHALSLALKYRDQYRGAGIPAVPVVKGVHSTKKKILAYTAALVPASFLPWALEMAGSLYLAAALASGAVYLGLGVRFLISRRDHSMFLFFYSVIYLTVLFTALVVDMRV